MPNQVTFNWEYVKIVNFGTIFRPYVRLQLQTAEGWKPFDFIADTGADLTMLPYSMVEILDLNLKKCKKSVATGIGGNQVTTWQTTIPIQIGDWELQIPVSITQDSHTPLLLGRISTLDSQFSWYFDYHKKQIIFQK